MKSRQKLDIFLNRYLSLSYIGIHFMEEFDNDYFFDEYIIIVLMIDVNTYYDLYQSRHYKFVFTR